MVTQKNPRERMVMSLLYDAVPDPLPELGLCRPELLTVAANYQRRTLLLFLLFPGAQFLISITGLPVKASRMIRAFRLRLRHQQTRDQFCAALDSKFREDMAQMKFDGLLTDI